jgi:carboxymethylenebutenolidase
MTSTWIDLTAATGETFGGYLALPPTGTGPGLVLFQEIFGVNRHIRSIADQYALDGFVVLVPDLFWRQGHRIELTYEGDDRDRAFALYSKLSLEDAEADGATSIAALASRPEVSGKIGAIGFCLGGRLAFRAAAAGRVDFACCYYGGGIHQDLHLAESITVPTQYHYGADDTHILPEHVAQVRAAMADKPAEFYVYENTGHGFNCWDRSAYHRASALLAHGRALQAMSAHLT